MIMELLWITQLTKDLIFYIKQISTLLSSFHIADME